jgi:hypothetical protein
MQTVAVAEVLAAEGLAAPVLNVLVPNEQNYSALLMQPQGDIEIRARVFAAVIRHWQMHNLGPFCATRARRMQTLSLRPSIRCRGRRLPRRFRPQEVAPPLVET